MIERGIVSARPPSRIDGEKITVVSSSTRLELAAEDSRPLNPAKTPAVAVRSEFFAASVGRYRDLRILEEHLISLRRRGTEPQNTSVYLDHDDGKLDAIRFQLKHAPTRVAEGAYHPSNIVVLQ